MRSIRAIVTSSVAIAVASASFLIAPAAYAQDEAADEGQGLSEIVVTAQRRSKKICRTCLCQ